MSLSLLSLLAATALAGEVQVQTSSPVIVKVDGQILEYPEGSMTVTARQLAGGTHSVEITSLTGRTLGSVNVNVPVDHQVRLQYQNKQLVVLGSGPMAPTGGQVVVNSGGMGSSVVVSDNGASSSVVVQDGMGMSTSMSVSIDDNTMNQLAALGYVDPGMSAGASVSITVNEGGYAPPPQRAPQTVYVESAPVASPMSPSAFAKLKAAVADESFSSDQVDLIRGAAANNWFTCAQLGQLLDELDHSSDRVEVAGIVRPKVVDPGNAFTLNEHLTFSSEKEEIQALFR